MTRLYSSKLVLLLILCFTQEALSAGSPAWKGVLSPKPAIFTTTSTGNLATALEISVEVPGFFVTEQKIKRNRCQQLSLPGGHPLAVPGFPDLQKLSFAVQLSGDEDADIELVDAEFTEYDNINIMPSPGNQLRGGAKTTIVRSEMYAVDAFFPGRLFSTGTPFIVRNKRAQAIQVYPLQYNPVTHKLRVYSRITLAMQNRGSAGLNPLTAADRQISAIDALDFPIVNRSEKIMKSAKLPSCDGRMLIVCPRNFNAAIQPLAAWREKTGTPVEIVDSEKFSTPELLFELIKDYYQSKGDLAYVLLVGDVQQVPTFVLPYGASDNYYSYLSGCDHYPDIFIGRFSAESVNDVETQVKRTLLYEQNPGSDPQWLTTATGIASTLAPGDDNESDFHHVRNLLSVLKSTTYQNFNEFFDGSQGGIDAAGNPSSGKIAEKINQGTGVIFYAGHGSVTTLATGLINKSVVETFTNTGKLPFVSAAACETGSFNGQLCLAESWMRACDKNGNPVGAVAAHMASGTQTTFPPMEAQDKIAELLARPSDATLSLGAVVASGLVSMNSIYGDAGFAMTDTYILFGDPALRIRTAIPMLLEVKHKGKIGSGRSQYQVACSAEKARVCLTQNGKIAAKSVITGGKATLTLDQPAQGEEFELTVTALNYLPSVSQVKIVKTPEPADNFSPANHDRLQPVNTTFSWAPGDGGTPDSYRFYLGTDNPPSNLINGEILTESAFDSIIKLKYATTYYWKVVSVNAFGQSESRIMDFKTVFQPDEDFEGLTKSRMVWNAAGAKPWALDGGQFFDGKQSIKSGAVKMGEYSSLLYNCKVEGCEFVSFWSKTSAAGEDVLQFIVDGAIFGEWSGNTGWNLNSYKIEEGNHRLEWRYQKNSALPAGSDGAWIDDIHLPVHSTAVSLAASATVCQGSAVETRLEAENYFSIRWETSGDGSFDDPLLPAAVYLPGTNDISSQYANLTMTLSGYAGCPDIVKQLPVAINLLPVISLPSDTIITGAKSVTLDAYAGPGMSYSWSISGEVTPSVVVAATALRSDVKEVVVTLTSAEGCSATKNIKVHFSDAGEADKYNVYPNPSNGIFNIAPVCGASQVSRISLVDCTGKTVWSDESPRTIIGSRQVEVQGAAAGIYVLLTESENGRSANRVVIR